MITTDSMAKIVTDYHAGVSRRVHEALNHVRAAIDDWIEQAIQGPLPDDWREQFRAVLEEQAAQGRRVLPECVFELEAWIENWATEYGLLPARPTTRSETGCGSAFDLSMFDGPPAFHTTPTLSHEEIVSLTTMTAIETPIPLFQQPSFVEDQLTPEQLKHWQTFAEFVDFDLNRKEHEAAEDAGLVAKGNSILFGVFTAMWEPAD